VWSVDAGSYSVGNRSLTVAALIGVTTVREWLAARPERQRLQWTGCLTKRAYIRKIRMLPFDVERSINGPPDPNVPSM
jgi:hypothetical protein